VAKKRGRHWIGIEKDEQTAEFAHARVEGVNVGDEVVRAKSTIAMMAAAMARRMMNCPKCSKVESGVARSKDGNRPTCPCCQGEVEPTAGKKAIPFDGTIDLDGDDGAGEAEAA